MPFSGFVWFFCMLLPLVYLQRFLHREIQMVIYFITRNESLTIIVYSILFLPGVFLHEASHYLMAKMLGVRTGKFSVIPQMMDKNRLRMGYVETVKSDVFRDSLIGLAPLIAGTLFVAYASIVQLQINTLWEVFQNGQWNLFFMGLSLLDDIPDFYLWFYLTFAVSSTMLPSESDRHSWMPLGIWIVVLFSLAILSGAGTWMIANIAPPLNNFLNSIALLFMLSNLVHLILFFPFYIFRRILMFFLL
jgi:hypothetical protein